MMHNRTYAAEIAHNVSSRKRVEIVALAKQLNVKLTVLSKTQSDYLDIPVNGPYKASHYRY